MTPTPQPNPVTPADRRIAQRFQPAFGTICRLDPAGSDDPAIGLVWNLSRTGVSMLMARPPERGVVLAVELSSESGPGLSVTLRVVHVRPLTTGDYLLGAQFTQPLKPDELQLFLAPPLPEVKPMPRG